MKNLSYNTNQKEMLIEVFLKNQDRQFSVSDIMGELNSSGKKIGLATIYRQLESLEQSGKIRKFTDENGKKACWQFFNGSENCQHHYHLKCEKCGKIVHLDCEFVSEIDRHILKDHGFSMDKSKTVFYGICSNCSEN